MADFELLVTITLDGGEVPEIKRFAPDEIVYRKAIKAGKKRGFANMFPEFNFSIDYVVPTVGKVNWRAQEDVRLTIEFDESATRETWRNCAVLSVKPPEVDFENELVQTITLFAKGFIEE